MSDLDRFRNLEKRRAGTDDGDRVDKAAETPATSRRFGKIEPRKTPEPGAAAAAHDPFAPPPEEGGDIPLEVREDDRREVAKQRAAHNAQSEAGLLAAREIVAENKADEKQPDSELMRKLIAMTMRERLFLVAGGTVVIAILALAFGKPLWGLEPILLVVAFVGLLAKEA